MKENLPQRKQIRLRYYNYASEGMYFITICTKNRLEILGNIKSNGRNRNCKMPVGADDPVRPHKENNKEKINLTPIGIIVDNCWKEIIKIYDDVETDEYVIMPNHIHGIINLTGGQSRPPLQKIIQGFKSVTTRECFKYGYKQIWQRNYYEHIIRNEKEYYKIVEYIRNNPLRWEDDTYFN